MKHADLSIDYARQACIPAVPPGTISDFLATRQGLDINMFAIFNESSGRHRTMLTTEDACHDSNSVISQLHYYRSHLDSQVDNAERLYLDMDPCSGQNKNNIMLGYCILRVLHRYQKRIVMKIMTAGHT